MRIEEFAPIKAWWKKRKQTDLAWKVSLKEIKARNYNLDFKNPYVAAIDMATPEELLEKYQGLQTEIDSLRKELKNELHQSLN